MKVIRVNSILKFRTLNLKDKMKDRIQYIDKERFDINYKETYDKINVIWGYYKIT